ncbi:hypothetical protein J6X15_00310 [Candidatus Saccharibacteria bacterium]|nr:hypothetical protein [Candidatus Saccharibacteria bacterium]
MNLLMEYYFRVISDTTETPEEISSFISQNIVRLIKSFQAAKLDPADLIKHMIIDDFIGRYALIMELVPEYDPVEYLRGKNLEYCYRDLIEVGVHPDAIVKASPNLFSFSKKIREGVSPNFIAETTEHMDRFEAEELLIYGADPNLVAPKADLTLELTVEYGINPKAIICSAMIEDDNLVRENIEKLFKNGLTSEELLSAEIKALRSNFHSRYEIFAWYIAQFELIVEFAEDGEGLTKKLMELVDEIYYGDDLMPLETGDKMFLEMMKQCVKHSLIGIDDAVDYLYNIHAESIEDDEDGNPIPFGSCLLDEDFVRAELTA